MIPASRLRALPAPFALSLAFALAPFVSAKPERKVGYEPPFPAGVSTAGINLLKGATATASGQWADEGPARALDGDLKTYWSCENLPVWHKVALAAPARMSAVRVFPYRDGGRVYQYKVEVSADGSTWTVVGDKTANSIVASPEGDLFEFAARPVKYVRATFTGNSAGAKAGGHLCEIRAYAEPVGEGLSGGVGTTDLRYPPSGDIALPDAVSGVKLTAWRGERVNAQVVLKAASAQRGVRLSSVGLHRAFDGSTVPVALNFVRYTLADGKPQGDILDDATSLDLAAGTNRPVWITVDVPRDALPGLYTGAVVATSDSGEVLFPVQIEVLPATLPAPRDWKCHLDLWQHPDPVARWHDVPMWSPEHFALMKPLMRRLADAGQKTITCTLIDEAWGGQTYDKFGPMVKWIRNADGSWSYDYSIFDKYVAFMSDECGFDRARIHCYTLVPWSLKFNYTDAKTGREGVLSLRPGTPEYEAHWGPFLKNFAAHLKAKSWFDRTAIGMDERPDALLKPAFAIIEKYAPGLKIASANNSSTGLALKMDDLSPSYDDTRHFPRKLFDERRAENRLTTYYVCTVPRVPNTFTFSPPAESEWLLLFASANGFDGFLRWAYDSWVENPLKSTDFTSWPSGDCFLVYPGNRSSVRFERLRDGVEDFEKIRILRDAAAKSGSPAVRAAIAKLDEILAVFTVARGHKPGVHAEDVNAARAAIEAATRALAK